ncbi:hypothetical protein [Brucella anthropi]|uniref:hypothetical protein n=1 Tax=Brucella anthropi TaxID=529 RepID=UPI00125DAE6F|nr:hypothetical protein [Brucella anthropi]QFP63335.1 hypothetical protein FT787_09580 [Brucella anthropi]
MNIVRAFDYAKFIARPLNLFVTIIFKERFDLIKINEMFRKIITWNTRWNNEYSKKHSLSKQKPVWLYVFENPQFNPHVHWCLNIRKEQIEEFKIKLQKWLKKIQGSIYSNSIYIQYINPYTDKRLANYMVKGIDEEYIEFLHLQQIASYQGPIYGQRARAATEIGPTAIKKSGFKASRDRHKWEYLHPWIAEGFTKPANWNVKKVVPKKFGVFFGDLSKYWCRLKRKWPKKRSWFTYKLKGWLKAGS